MLGVIKHVINYNCFQMGKKVKVSMAICDYCENGSMYVSLTLLKSEQKLKFIASQEV